MGPHSRPSEFSFLPAGAGLARDLHRPGLLVSARREGVHFSGGERRDRFSGRLRLRWEGSCVRKGAVL